jgi:DNA-binding GntR family transcriptional regulator
LSDNLTIEEYGREAASGKSLSDNGRMPPAEHVSDPPATAGSPFDGLSLEHSSTVERVAEELRRAVFEGELESGTPLREVALAESLGVSRPTLREALALLVAEGLATREPHRGVSVAIPDPESVRDVSTVRAVLETAGVRNWPHATEEARAAVRRALGDYEDAVAAGATYQELNQRHLAIHLGLVGLTGSPRLVSLAESVVAELRLVLAQLDRVRRNARDQAGSHHHLLDLLESGDIDTAVDELGHHLHGAEDALIERLELD